jgi:acetyl-CoA carboxylase biotin carboxyl carrier protein
MDIRKIKTLIEMLEGSTLKEIEVSQGDESVRISKQTNDVNVVEKDNTNEPSDQFKISDK